MIFKTVSKTLDDSKQQPMYAYGSTRFRVGSYADISGIPFMLDNAHPYSFGGWIRTLAEPGEQVLLTYASSQKNLSLLGFIEGLFYFRVIQGNISEITVPLQIGVWQYVMCTFLPTGNGTGTFTIYINGDLAKQQTVSGLTPFSMNGALFQLGGGGNVGCLNFSIWSICLTQEQAKPQYAINPATSGLELNADFSVYPAVDHSGNNRVITYSDEASISKLTKIYPCLAFDGASVAQPNDSSVNPGNGAEAFSISAWIHPASPIIQDEVSNQWTIFANGTISALGVILYLQYNPTTQAFQAFAERGGPTPILSSNTTFNGDEWHHVAVTYDGSTMSLYLDGVLSASAKTQANNTPAFDAALAIGAVSDPLSMNGYDQNFRGYMQAVTVWNNSLSAADVITYMHTEPTDSPNCIAYYGFTLDRPINAITSQPVALYGNAMITELSVEGQTSQSVVQAAGSKKNSSPTQAQTNIREALLAKKFDLTVCPTSSLISHEKIDGLAASFENYLTAHAPADKHQYYRELFRNNLYQGIYLQESCDGPMPGTVTFEQVEQEYVFYHYTLDGREECGRFSVLEVSACDSWLITVIATSLGVLLNVLGVGYTATRVVGAIFPAIVANQNAGVVFGHLLALDVTPSLVIKIIRTLYGVTSFTTVISSILSNLSWWNWFFTIASVIIQIVSLWLTGGLYLVYVLAQLALSIAQLIYVVNQKPDGCNPPPQLSSLAPFSSTVGQNGVTVTVNGQSFLQGAQGRWNGLSRTTTWKSASQIEIQLTGADLAQAGTGKITVLNPSSNNVVSNSLNFYVTSS